MDFAEMKNKNLLWIYVISSLVYFLQGIDGVPGLALFLFLKEKLGFTAEKIMYLGAITTLAWVVKPLWGFLCDNYLTKKKWIILSLFGSLVISLLFGFIAVLPFALLVSLLTIGNLNAAVRDVATDAVMCIEGKKDNNCGCIQAIQWISITVASIIVGLGGGYIAQHFTYKIGYLCLIPVYLVGILIVSNYAANKTTNRCTDKTLWTKIASYKELFINKKFLLVCLFLFLYKYAPSFGTPLMFIERDTFKWSAMWLGTLGAIVSCFEILGAFIYFRMCKKINIKKWLIISVWLGAITTMCYLYFTPITAIVYSILFAIMGMFVHLIVMAFMAESTLSGKEATSFALLCSINNFANTCSSLSGAYLFPKIGLSPLIVLSSVTSFACLFLIPKIFSKND